MGLWDYSNTFKSKRPSKILDLYIFPDVNPDGGKNIQNQIILKHSLTFHNLPGGERMEIPFLEVLNGDDPNHGPGVDINRNFDFFCGIVELEPQKIIKIKLIGVKHIEEKHHFQSQKHKM